MASRGVNVLMRVEGGAQLKRALKKKREEFLREMAAALPDEGQALMAQANVAAPRASGTLVGSSSVTTVEQRAKGRVRVAAAYLDPKAAAVHEGLHWGRHVPGTKGFKWYERTLAAFEGGFVERIAARLRRLVGGGS